MKVLAETDENVAARLKLFDYRVMEELYDVSKDPDCLTNLIDNPEYAQQLVEVQGNMKSVMTQSSDHALEAFDGRDDEAVVNAYMKRVEEEAAVRALERRKKKKAVKGKGKKAKAK